MSLLSRISKIISRAPRFRRGGRRSYSSAIHNRLTEDWVRSASSQDSEARAALAVLRDRARDGERNNDWIRGQLFSVEANIIGLGIRLQSNIKNSKGESDTELNKKIEEEWKKWCRPDSCDVTGRMSMPDMQRLIARSMYRDGETPLIRFIYKKRGKSRVPFSLQFLEQDRIDEKLNRPAAEGQNAIKMGVEIDEYGKALFYHIHRVHPGDSALFKSGSTDLIKVPADKLIHGFRLERAEQTRAVSLFSAALSTIRQLKGFIDAVVIRKRVEASIMYFIKTLTGEAPITSVEDAESAGNPEKQDRLTDIVPAGVHYLAQDEDVVSPPINSTNAGDESIKAGLLRDMATSTGISYESTSGDFTKTNYSSSRMSKLSERELFRIIQQWIADNVMQPIFEEWIKAAEMNGVIKIPGYSQNPEQFNQPKWLPRGWSWVDPQKDIQATVTAVKSGLTTMTEALAERGLDFEETMNQIKKERERINELGLELDIFPDSSIVTQKVEDENVVEN